MFFIVDINERCKKVCWLSFGSNQLYLKYYTVLSEQGRLMKAALKIPIVISGRGGRLTKCSL